MFNNLCRAAIGSLALAVVGLAVSHPAVVAHLIEQTDRGTR
jgi:hypothetical protein